MAQLIHSAEAIMNIGRPTYRFDTRRLLHNGRPRQLKIIDAVSTEFELVDYGIGHRRQNRVDLIRFMNNFYRLGVDRYERLDHGQSFMIGVLACITAVQEDEWIDTTRAFVRKLGIRLNAFLDPTPLIERLHPDQETIEKINAAIERVRSTLITLAERSRNHQALHEIFDILGKRERIREILRSISWWPVRSRFARPVICDD